DQARARGNDLAQQVAGVVALLDEVAVALEHRRLQQEAARIQAGHQERGRHAASLRRGTRTGNARGVRSDSGHHALAAAPEAEDLLEAIGKPGLETEQRGDAVVVEAEAHVAAAPLGHVLDEEAVRSDTDGRARLELLPLPALAVADELRARIEQRLAQRLVGEEMSLGIQE